MNTFCLFCPHFPALAARYALRVAEVVVQRKGKVLALTPGVSGIGVEIGMSVERAARLLEGVRIVERDAAREVAVWDAIMDRLFDVTPLLVSARPGEAYCEANNSSDNRSALKALLQELQAQGGIAQTRTLAKLAAVYATPGKTTFVEQKNIPRFLAAWKVENLLELDYPLELVEKLKLFGLSTLTHLQHLTRRHLHVQFGDDGLRLHDTIKQIPVRSTLPLYNPAPMVVQRLTFDSRQREPGILEAMLNEVMIKVLDELQHQRASTIEVGMLDRDGFVACRLARILKPPPKTFPYEGGSYTSDPFAVASTSGAPSKRGNNQHSTLCTGASIMLREMMSPHRWCHGIEVKLKGLSPPPTEQLPLFEKRASIDTVGRTIARRYPNALVRVDRIIHDAYLPEEAVRLVRYENPPRSD